MTMPPNFAYSPGIQIQGYFNLSIILISAFTQKILTTVNEVKLTQQQHSQCLAQLLGGSEIEPHHSQEIPQLPFAKIEDLLEFDEELSHSGEARAGMVNKFIL